MAHLHSIYDTDLHFIIDPITRRISSESGKVTLMQKDHNSERFTFEVPRYIEGHDMSLTDIVQVHYNNIEAASPKRQNKDVYPVLDLQISPDSDDVVIFSWLISGNATQYVGSLNFIVRFVCYDGEEIVYQWWSDTYTQIKIAATMDNTGEAVDLDDTDILESWRQQCIQAVFESEVFSTLEAQGKSYVNQAKVYAEQAREISGLNTIDDIVEDIRSVMTADISAPGWYRVAEYFAGTSVVGVQGAFGNSCDIFIKTSYRNTPTMVADIALKSRHLNQNFYTLLSGSSTDRCIDKIRYVYDKTAVKAYLEIHYTKTISNAVNIELTRIRDSSNVYLWKTIAPVLTEETVNGITVTATHEIPKNASLITDMDLTNVVRQYMPITYESLVLKTPILETAVSLPVGSYDYALGGAGYTGDELPDNTYTYGTATINKRSANSIFVMMWGHVAGDAIYPPIFNYYNGTKWSGWNDIVTGKEFVALENDMQTEIDNITNGTTTVAKATYAATAGSAPASDVYPWAKASTKPSYTKSEVGLGNVDNTADSAKSVKYAADAGNASKLGDNSPSYFATAESVNKIVSGATTVAKANSATTASLDGAGNDIATTAANLSSEIAVERARISQLSSLSSGSTTGDAELMGIRIDVNGVDHDNAGDAVRAQFRVRNVKSEPMTEMEEVTLPVAEVKAAIVQQGEETKAAIAQKGVETLETIPDDYTTLANEVAEVKSDLSELSSEIDNQSKKLFEYGTVGNDITNASFVTLLGEGLNSIPDDANGRIIAEINEGFDTYYFYAWENDLSIYLSETDQPAYLSLTTIDNPTTEWTNRSNGNGFEIYGSNPIRYRNLDGNLPTEISPLTLSTGAMCALTVTHGENAVLYVRNQPTSLLNNNIRLNTEQIEQVFQKKPVIEYVRNSSEDSSPNALNIYIPTNNGYVKYVFAHCVKQDINADVWRIANAYATDNLFNLLYNITTNGEWECALKINGRSDFSGGRMHGDEVMSSIKFFIDGKVFTPNEITEKTTFKEIRIIQTSTLYDASDSVTAIAIHTSEHIFKNSENDCDVTIRQTVKWLGNYQLSNCYLAMFPISKDVSSEVYTDIDYTSEAIINNMIKNNAKSAKVYSEENGVFTNFSIGKYVSGLEGGDRFQISDNGGADYNKCYYHCCSNASVQEGDLWQSESMYNIQIAN